jgi:hypothetical protein
MRDDAADLQLREPFMGESERDAPGEHVAEENEITRQTVERMRERGGAILFEYEMAYPREPIARNRRKQQEPRFASDERRDDHDQNQRRTHKVQAATGPIAVLRQVVGIKRGEARVTAVRYETIGEGSHQSRPEAACGGEFDCVLHGAGGAAGNARQFP